MNVGTAVFTAVGKFGPLIKSSHEASQALSGVESASKGVGGKVWDKAKKGFLTGAKVVAAGTAGMFGTALVKGMGRLTAIDTAQGKLRGLGHDAQSVKSIMNDALESVKGTSFGLEEAATTAAGAVAAGIKPGQQLQKYLKIVADTSAIAGVSMADMGQIMNRVQTSGVMMADDLNMLGDKGIPILTWLADEYGVTTQAMKKMVSEGKVDAETYASVLEKNIGAESSGGRAALAMGDTFVGALKNAWAAVGRVGANLLSGVFPYFQQFLNKIQEWLGPIEDRAKAVGDALGKWLGGAIERVKELFSGASDSGFVDFLTRVRDVVKGVFEVLSGGTTGGLAQALNVDQGHPIIGFLQDVSKFVTDTLPKGFSRLSDIVSGVFQVLSGGTTGKLANALGVDQGHTAIKMFQNLHTRIVDTFTWLRDEGIPALIDLGKWLKDNAATIGKVVAVLGGLAGAYKVFQSIRRVMLAVRIAKQAYALATYGAAAAETAQTKAGKIGNAIGKARVVVTKAMTVAQKALNLALGNNPIGWIIKGIAAFIAIGVLAYKSSDEFRAVIDKLWQTIKDGAQVALGWLINEGIPLLLQGFQWLGDKAAWLWENVLSPVFGWIGDKAAWLAVNVIGPMFKFIGDVMAKVINWMMDTGWPIMQKVFGWIGDKAVWLWENAISPAFGFIWAIAKKVFAWLRDTGWPIMQKVFGWIGEKATWLWEKIISPVFGFIWDVAKKVFAWFRDTGWPIMRKALQEIGDKAMWLWEKIVSPAFNGIATVISTAWDAAKKIFDKFKSGLNSLRDRFSSIKSSIVNIWGTIARSIGKPINAAIRFFNKFLGGLEKAINLIPGVEVSLPRIKEIDLPAATRDTSGSKSGGGGGGSAFLAEGGTVPGRSPHERADNIPAMLTADEEVIKRRSARNMRRMFPGALEFINRTGRLPGYADGGRVGKRKPRTGGGLGDVWDAVIGAGKKVLDFVGDPVGTLKKIATDLLAGIGDSWPAQAMVGIGKDMIGKFAQWVHDKFVGSTGGYGGENAVGMAWPAIWSLVSRMVPGAVMTSNYRAMRSTASGAYSYHNRGRAVDFVSGNMGGAWEILRRTGMPWSELYYTPKGFIRNGRLVSRDDVAAITKANHYDHVHVAMRTGGWIPGQGPGDRTKVLAEPREFMINRKAAAKWGPLLTAINRDLLGTGNLDLFSALSKAQAGSIASVRSMTGVAAGIPQDAVYVKVDGDFVVDNTKVEVTVNNPVREPSYDSVQKRLNRTAQLGLIGARRG